MNIEQSLDTYLKADTALAAIVSTRIYWMQAVQSTIMPYLVYQSVSDTDDMFAFGNTDTGHALVQFDLVGSLRSHKSGIMRVRELMRGFSGVMGGTGGVTVYTSLPSNMRDTYNPDTNKYIFSCDYHVEYKH